MSAPDLKVEYLRERLRYEPSTGKLFWLKHPGMSNQWNSRFAGKEALTALDRHGYRKGRVGQFNLLAHRVCFAIYHGRWPNGLIDHIDHNRANNCIENLREVSHSGNAKNTNLPSDNTSGVMGVVWVKREKRWKAQIKSDGVHRYLGTFTKFEDAVRARKAAEKEAEFHENHGIRNPLATLAPTA